MTSRTIATVLFAASALATLAFAATGNAQEQRDQARANFEQADVNKDGHHDLAEFTTFINLNAEHGLGRAGRIRRLGMYSRAFATLDTNGDGLVSKQQVAAQAQR